MLGCSMSPFEREHPYAVHYTLMYFWNSSPTDCLAVSVTYNSSKQWSTGERIVYFTVCFISWVPEVFSCVRRGPSSAAGRHVFRQRPKTRTAKGTQGTHGFWHPEYLFHFSLGLEKNSNYIVLLVGSSHILFAQGHFLLPLVNDFVRRWVVWTSCSLGK